MVLVIQKEGKEYYRCERCGARYADRETAEKCQAWCSAHKSCNLEIISHAIRDGREVSSYAIPLAIVVAGMSIGGAIVYKDRLTQITQTPGSLSKLQHETLSALAQEILPKAGVPLPITWGDLGVKLISTGTIDGEKFLTLYEEQGALTDEYQRLLLDKDSGIITITKENAGYLLNLFWALGLGNDNPILRTGELSDPQYGGARNFASTAGWTMAKGGAMSHYSRHSFVTLTLEQQSLVEKVSKGVYRPCCDNSTHFPDCNHGMAMLGLLELLASQGASEEQMWRSALAVNSYWFPDTYLTIASYLGEQGIDWSDTDPREILGPNYSSASGYKSIASRVTVPHGPQSTDSCGIDTDGVLPVSLRATNRCNI